MTLMHSLVRKNRLWKSSVVCVMRYDVKCHAYMAHTSLDYSRNSKKKTPLYIVERRFFWWEQRESNPRPSACKADALNQLSYAPFGGADGTRTRDPRRDRPVF